ncbi:kinase-like domain-containing protein [Scenedesmus sp. NREL 46B-D3]|nr:kinase-like domain-containing protein [Scenedesmus sp. NREL 46B-D3]
MPLLHLNDVVRDDGHRSYRVTRRLGEGQFAEVWEVRLPGTDLHYALKLEKRKDRNTVRAEYKVMKKIGQSGGCSQVVAVEGCGMHQERFFMLLQLAGETLYDARKAGHGKLDLPTVKAVGMSTLTAIQQLHEQHVIHRDIKPANFVIDPPNAAAGKGSWLLIDFGLARRFTDEAGSHLPQRSDASFRGSTTYASVHAHKDEDLSRRDDLWSWLYMLTELLEGWLPWRLDKDAGEQHPQDRDKDKHWVQQQKELCIEDANRLSRSGQLPEALAAISRHLASLGFADVPDYDHLRQCLQLLPDPQPQLLGLLGQLQQQQQQLDEQDQDGQQWGAALHDQQQQQQQQFVQQGVGGPGDWQQHWGGAAGALHNGQQQEEQVQISPASPLRDQTPPARAAAGAAAAAAKRPPSGSAAGSEQIARRRKAEAASSSQPRKSGM